MTWEPIDKYDKLRKKPANAVFLVAEHKSGRSILSRMISVERRFGFRTVTHYCVLPDLPEEDWMTGTIRNHAMQNNNSAGGTPSWDTIKKEIINIKLYGVPGGLVVDESVPPDVVHVISQGGRDVEFRAASVMADKVRELAYAQYDKEELRRKL